MGAFLRVVMARLGVLLNNSKFKEAISKKMMISVNLPKEKFLVAVQKWIESNPLKAQAVLASSLSVIPSALPNIFGSEELPVVAAELQNVDFVTGNYNEAQTASLEAISGDRAAGYFGQSNEEVVKSADLMAASLKKTEKIARLFGIREGDVEEAVMLLQSYELADGQIYKKLRG